MILDVRIDGFPSPVGALTRRATAAVEFQYAADYLALENAVPISLAIPLREEAFDDRSARGYFANLLPENDQMQRVMEREGLDRSDIVGILFHLGADCPGAISCLPQGAPAAKIPGLLSTDYDFLNDEEINDIARRLADREPLPDVMRDPSPVAGVQRKIALIATDDGRFALPKRNVGAPTTHILKMPARRDAREADLEAAAARLAAACGLDVAVPAVTELGGAKGLLVRRFDRILDNKGLVRRIHQEDFAQALGLPPGLKYERNAGTGGVFNFDAILHVLRQCAEPALALQSFLKATFFNLAIGNSDNHAKNHALLYDQGRAPRLAPLYDLLPIRISAKYTHQYAFRIGGATDAETLAARNIETFLRQAGMTEAAVARFIRREIQKLLVQLDTAADSELSGLKDFADLIGMESRRVVELLGLDVKLTDRDYFAPQASGWATS